MAAGLGGLKRIYHESLTEGGAAGLAYLQLADPNSYALVQAKQPDGTALEATESWELLTETLDLQRCLLIPFTNETVLSHIREWFDAANRRRYEYIAQRIDETLQGDETGLLLINERHQVQFPADLEVFYIAPPALDEFRRWLQNWAARRERETVADAASGIRHVSGAMMLGGGVPVEAAGEMVGGIGVSGAPGGDADAECATAGIEAVSDALEF